jgi:TPR repeat protein/S1-C subfamily serine protease
LCVSAAFGQVNPPSLDPQGDFFKSSKKIEAEALKSQSEAKELYIIQGMKKDREQAVEIWRRLALIQPKENAPILNEVISQSALNSGEFEAARRALIMLGELLPDSPNFQTANLESVVWQSPQASFAVRIIEFTGDNRLRGVGSGTIISSDGWVLTAAHAVANLEKPGVQFADGTAHAITLIHPGLFLADLALVKVDRRTPQPPSIATSQPNPSDPVYSISFPSGCLVPVLSKGVFNKKNHLEGQSHYETTLSGLPGSSGGGVFNQKGELIGVVYLGPKKTTLTAQRGTCWVVPLEEVQSLLSAWKGTEAFPINEKEDWKERSVFWARRSSRDFNDAIALMASDPRKAISLLEDAYDDGNIRAGYILGVLYSSLPNGTDEDRRKGFNFFDQSSEVMPASLAFRGLMKMRGIGTKADSDGGVKDLISASDQGSALASAHLGWIYFQGEALKPDHAKAMAYANKAAEKGEPLGIALKLLGLLADLFSYDKKRSISSEGQIEAATAKYSPEVLKSEKAVEFFNYCSFASKQDAPGSTYLYGICHLHGIGTDKDIEKAISILEVSANNGETRSMEALGSIYFLNKDLPRDLAKSMYWSGKAAEKGKLNHKVLYAGAEIMMKSSRPGDFLSPRSLGYLEEGCAANIAQAQEMLGLVYLDGKLAPKDLGKSVSLLEKAKKNGSQIAGTYLSLARVEYEAEMKSAK